MAGGLSKAQKIYLEEILFERPETEERINRLKHQILHEQPHMEVVPGAGYISDPTARKAVNLNTNRWIVKHQAELEAVDRALAMLNGKHQQLYQLKYNRGERNWRKIASQMKYSVPQCYRIRDQLLLAIARELGMVD